jgi:hypothetical protein
MNADFMNIITQESITIPSVEKGRFIGMLTSGTIKRAAF